MFAEDWRRLVIKMATGTGKTKILALSLVWSYFHKLYEADSGLARNFLVIAPNIIVLERIRKDFDGYRFSSKILCYQTMATMTGTGGKIFSLTYISKMMFELAKRLAIYS